MSRAARDAGMALVTTIVLGLVMLTIVTTGLMVATNGLRQSTASARTGSALDAAFAGVQDYIARVNLDDAYVKYGNPLSTFSATSAVTLDSSNPAFGVGVGGTWANLPGSGGVAKFRYEVDTSLYKTSGVVRLRVTGLSGTSTRTLLASLRVRGFVDYSYFTDYEIADPQISGASSSCVLHAWEGRASGCGSIKFGPTDALSGDVHSNDTMVICGATFTGNITTANPTTPLYSTTGCPSGTATTISKISYAAALPMPSTNSSMRTDAACLYTGPTKITYNAAGTMTVVSPWTQYTKVVGGAGTNNPAVCGDPSALRSTAGATVPQLDHDLLYVQNVPAVTSDPNYWATTQKPAGVTCIGADGNSSGTADGIGWSLGSGAGAIRYPLSNEAPATNFQNSTDPTKWSTSAYAYGCRNGDLYMQGRITTQTTAASEDYVYAVGDVTYDDQNADILGIVGQNGVIVWNPVKSDGSTILTDPGREIDAAILSVAHTFFVQNYDQGSPRGSLKVFGSIGQKFRGIVAGLYGSTVVSGYSKSYAYDPLLKTVSPPKFLNPSATSFVVTRYASVPAAFNAQGG